jgi:hypothetical protein
MWRNAVSINDVLKKKITKLNFQPARYKKINSTKTILKKKHKKKKKTILEKKSKKKLKKKTCGQLNIKKIKSTDNF